MVQPSIPRRARCLKSILQQMSVGPRMVISTEKMLCLEVDLAAEG